MNLETDELDWFDELSEEQQADVLEGIAQADRGETFTHEEAKKRFGLSSQDDESKS